VQLHDEIAARLERPRCIRRFEHRHLARRPAEDVLHEIFGHGREPGTRIGAIERTRRPRRIERNVGVVEDAWIAGAELDGANVAGFRRRDGHDEVTKHLAIGGPYGKCIRTRHHEVGRAQLPAIGKYRRRAPVCRVACGRTLCHPLLDEGDLIVTQTALVDEAAVTRFRQPGRHRPRAGRFGDCLRVCVGARVVEQAEGRTGDAELADASWPWTGGGPAINRPMTGRAVRVQDRRDVLVEGDDALGRIVRCLIARRHPPAADQQAAEDAGEQRPGSHATT
jgi:hypothetical protein